MQTPCELLKIGAVAERSGVSVKTIRFYCDRGLLQPASRSESGYRFFDESVLTELAFIRHLRAMDLPIAAVKNVIRARRSGVCTCTDLQSTIQRKRSEIRQRVNELQSLESELSNMLKSWESCGRG